MSNDSFELYDELSRLRKNLQIKYYDKENNRKPSICSDATLKLISRYKPLSLKEMEKISGIGETFLNNYGIEFITIIKKYSKHTQEELSTDEKNILSKLENRLVNINKRNRLLYSGKLNKKTSVDILRYFDDFKEIEDFIIKQDSTKLKILDYKTSDENKLKTIIKIIRQSEKNEVETGVKELYIAFPFVQGKMENENFNIKAPLMLFPINIIKTSTSIFIENDKSRDILYNTTLILANNKFNKKNEVLPDKEVSDYDANNYLNNMMDFYSKNGFLLENKNNIIEKFYENKNNEFPKYRNGELEIKKYMVLGLYSTYVTSMYEDFHKMIERNDITKLIKDLLWGIQNEDSSSQIQYSESNQNEKQCDKIENNIQYINELDSSQEKVLEKINRSKSLVIQGPPGTGKSQTITSIIAQSILNNKSVLMVSEKKTALDVIYSRLGNLSKFCMLIDDVENKELFYKQLNDVISNLEKSYFSDFEYNKLIPSINEKIEKINENIGYLEEIDNKVYGINDFNVSMNTIYNDCKKIDFNNKIEIDIYNFLKCNKNMTVDSFKYPTLKSVYEKLKKDNIKIPVNDYLLTIRYNPEIDLIKQNLLEIDLYNMNSDLDSISNLILEYNNYNFIKKIINKNIINDRIKDFANKYFIKDDKKVINYIFTHVEFLKDFIKKYNEYISNKFIYDKLSFEEKEYVKLVSELKNTISLSFDASVEQIYNFILYEKIQNFEKENSNILNYINNFDNIRTEIRENIIEKKSLTKELAYANLLENLKKINDNNNLNKIKEISNRKRKMPVTKFMNRFKFEMMDSIKIWLMTPETVSDILNFEKNIFDLVIFDEASQLYVEKAIPAIYRAKKVVVAGDQKQLKPSSLGQGRVLDEIEDDEISDGFLEYESLLDAANYKFAHTMLNYHYRSKYNELIAFSNYAFYGGKLFVTSNAEYDLKPPIERILVKDGRWIDKKNEKEAKSVVNLVKDILKNRKSNETLGVITFNSSQMNLIEDYIDKEMAKDNNFASMMMAEKNRFENGENISFFVKNIESVQGDERDIIIFCIGYAKNEVGRVSVNFGWLNQDGGENRLNVAISRAKQKIYVVTSIEPEELVVDNTKNNGPKFFKEYLKYTKAVSENNNELVESILYNLNDNNQSSSKEQFSFDSVFEEEVCNKLIEKGYAVKTQYGVGGYKIDIVITNKSQTKNILGIECDGRLYHSSKYARERDYHRQKYLESRGWMIYRIWSTNWWKNPELEMKKIELFLKDKGVNYDEEI